MRELFETIYVHLWTIIHHRWIVLCTCIVISIIGWPIVAFLPDEYEVEAKILFDTRSVLKPLLDGLAVDNSTREESALAMRQTLITRYNLLKVINKTDLNLNVTGSQEVEEEIRRLKQNIKISAISLASGGSSNLYNISYKDENNDQDPYEHHSCSQHYCSCIKIIRRIAIFTFFRNDQCGGSTAIKSTKNSGNDDP